MTEQELRSLGYAHLSDELERRRQLAIEATRDYATALQEFWRRNETAHDLIEPDNHLAFDVAVMQLRANND